MRSPSFHCYWTDKTIQLITTNWIQISNCFLNKIAVRVMGHYNQVGIVHTCAH